MTLGQLPPSFHEYLLTLFLYSSCWVIINNNVFDVTKFLSKHPGGPNIILQYAGRDATAAYEPIHPSDAIQRSLSSSQCLGSLKSEAIQKLESKERTKDQLRVEQAMKQRPPLNRILNLADMEVSCLLEG